MLNPKTIDLHRLKNDLQTIASEAVELKRRLRATWTEPMGSHQRALAELRRRATRLCILRAFLRGRRHLRRAPRDGWAPGQEWNSEEYHARMAERCGREYQLPCDEPAAIDEAS